MKIFLSPQDKRYNPHFKPDWNEPLFLASNYLNHLSIYRTSLLREIGGFRLGYEGSQDHDLTLRCVLKIRPSQIRHIPRILYHWRQFPGSGSFSDRALEQCKKARRQAVADYLETKNVMQLLLVAVLVLIRSTTHSKSFHSLPALFLHEIMRSLPRYVLTVYCTIQIMLPLRLFL